MSGSWKWCAVWSGLLGVLSGCSAPGSLREWPTSGVTVHSVVTEERSDSAWQAFERLAALTPEEAAQQLPEALAAFRAERTADARLWVLLLLLKAPYREFGDAWALEVLDAVGGGARPSENRRSLEGFLRHLFAERLAREGALQRAEASSEKERDAVRALQATVTAERERAKRLDQERAEAASTLRSLRADLTAERARVRDLGEQLEKLTAIEKILQRREGTAGGKGSP